MFIIIVGILFGKLSSFLLKKVYEKTDLGKKLRPSIIVLLLFIIRWSIYILFINFAIVSLKIPALTELLVKVLLVLPSFTGAIILLVLGFGIAVLLKNVIRDLNLQSGGALLSEVLFYFIWYIFGIYALRTALISLDENVRNYIILIWTTVVAVGLMFYFIISTRHQISTVRNK